ncbi:MAG: conjugal transfer protein TraF [Bacteroidia bacterium]|nr:conjugal transfer protein TraF [Bacteroidia bacterium]
MRKLIMAMAAIGMFMVSAAFAAEFQPLGALGMGGAGVARNQGAYASYWNPAGLAFEEKTVSTKINASVGLRVSEGLADDVDLLSKVKFDSIKNLSGSSSASDVTDLFKSLTIVNDIKNKNGNLSISGDTVLGVQIKHIGFGVFGTIEGFAEPNYIDTTNVLPSYNGGTGAITAQQLANIVAISPPPPSNVYFSLAQRIDIHTALEANGFLPAQAENIINATDKQLAGSGLSAQDVTNTLTKTVAPAFSNSSATIDNNKTSILAKSIAYVEVPISYGYPLDLGNLGTLGIGGSLKVIEGRVYQTQTFLYQSNSVKSDDIVSNMTKNYKDSTNFGIDVGVLWKYQNWLNVGLVAKNLNAPEFDEPNLKEKNGNEIPGSGGKTKLNPQVRMGIDIDPLDWVSFAVDMDITNNDTILANVPGTADYNTRNLGGGVEIHPAEWLKIRGGLYKNLAESDIGTVATAGFTIGIKGVTLELD